MKTKHPQLLYESKLYKILQGGSKSLPSIAVVMCQVLLRFVQHIWGFAGAQSVAVIHTDSLGRCWQNELCERSKCPILILEECVVCSRDSQHQVVRH